MIKFLVVEAQSLSKIGNEPNRSEYQAYKWAVEVDHKSLGNYAICGIVFSYKIKFYP